MIGKLSRAMESITLSNWCLLTFGTSLKPGDGVEAHGISYPKPARLHNENL